MKQTPTSEEPLAVAVAPASDEPPTRSAKERWAIRGIVVLVVGVICVAVVLTVGRDISRAVRQLSMFRRYAPLPGNESTASTGRGFTSDSDEDEGNRRNVKLRPADAMVVAPRRKKKATESAEATSPEEETAVPDDASVAANHEGGSVNEAVAAVRMTNPVSEAPADLTNNLLEAAARLVSLSWQDFDYPVRWPTSDPKSKMIFANHRNRLLKGTSQSRPSALSLEFLRKDYAAARAQFPDDPRLDYAFGLVLWKHQQFEEATEMFQMAARLDDVPFLPAALAVAWARFLNHDDRRGLDQLAHIARLLATTKDAYPAEAQKQQAAIAIGRALGYLSGPGQVSESIELVELTARNILDRLPEHLRDACETGRREIGIRQSELMQLNALPGDSVARDHQRLREQLQTQVQSLRTEMQDARNVLNRNHVTKVNTVREILKDVLDVRGKMDKLYPTIEQMKETVFKLSQPQVHTEVIPLPTQYASIPQNNGGPPQIVQYNGVSTYLVPETPAELAARVAQLEKARDQLKKIETDLSELRDKQRELVEQRHEADDKEKLEQAGERRVRVARLAEQRELEQRLTALEKALSRVTSLREGIESIAAYVSWNVEVEGEAIWHALNSKSASAR